MTKIKHLYVHVPFCKTICYYCDFCHRVYDDELANKWLDIFKKEIQERCHDQYETIYIGGGTPTCLSFEQLDRLLYLISVFSSKVIEYTIEVNPETLDLDKILLLKKYGINRVSMGLQSSNDDLLKLMNRNHSFNDVKEKVKLLKDNGINNISIDLMYSLPNQNIDILNNTIDDILTLEVPHISLYSLTIEERTVFGKKGYKSLDEEIEADMYELIENRLIQNNYIHYEISNYCLKGYESKHNLGYWNYDDFVGLSLGASGKIGNNRYTNTRDFKKYLAFGDIKDEDIELSLKDLKFENIMMSLRTIYGLNIENFNKRYNCDLIQEYKKGLDNFNVYIDDGYLKVKNLEILNSTLLDFMIE